MTVRCALLAMILFGFSAPAAAEEWQPYALSDALGDTLDAAECEHYGLFPEFPALETVRILRRGGDFKLSIELRTDGEIRTQEREVSRESVELTRRHVVIVDRYDEWEGSGVRPGFTELQWNWLGLSLRYATVRDLSMSLALLDDLDADLTGPAQRSEIASLRNDIQALESNEPGLHGGMRAYDESGRFDLVRYSGLWGIWAAIALPASIESDDPKLYAASLMAVPTASILGAINWSRERNVGKGRSAFIGLGGNLGIWHGLGWAGLADLDGNQMVGIALGASAAGIVLGAGLGDAWKVTEGHGQLTSSALYWGMWYGVVFANFGGTEGDVEGDDVLRSMLWTSIGTVGGMGILARGSELKQNQVRLINLGGIVGTLFGFGVDVIVEVDDSSSAFAIAGVGTTAGLLVAWNAVRGREDGLNRITTPGGTLGLGAVPDRLGSNRPMPALTFAASF